MKWFITVVIIVLIILAFGAIALYANDDPHVYEANPQIDSTISKYKDQAEAWGWALIQDSYKEDPIRDTRIVTWLTKEGNVVQLYTDYVDMTLNGLDIT